MEKLFDLKGQKVTESELLAQSGGYLFEAGVDEWGMPEITFSVEQVGLKGASKYGGTPLKMSIDTSHWRGQLASLLSQEG
ncbi:hypothetical protein [Xenorhabdus ishibashii]|uniref:Uncharacterized protein n=1 Tax=Xenorhabdus ishibashii TaxID=1034471 RepID=A0A2D0KE41_9GAMM|nr:hypothetical protein [Xenorhabdus ishibashii]PHM61680.1 hypothetical protein Xish_00819 [Xenorhabdus ishibashii]